MIARSLYNMIKVVHMSTEVAAPPQPGVEAKGSTRERILDAAERCMARHGIRRVSMADVAAQAGLSRGALYLHFAHRAALVDAVLERTSARFVSSSEAAVRRRRTLAAQVAEAAVFIREHLGDVMLTLPLPADDSLLATIMTAQIDRLGQQWVAFWRPLLAAAEDRGEIRPGLDHGWAGEWIVRELLSFALLAPVTFDRNDPDRLRAFVAAHVVAGLSA
jgi:AcrR family transcriptional regulator